MAKLFQNTFKEDKSKTFFLLLIILLSSILPRIWNLDKYPPTVVDEPANIRDIDLMLKNGISLASFHWDYSKSQAVHLPVLLLIKLGIGNKSMALRYTSVIISLAALIPFFLIAKHLSDTTAAFSSTLLFSFGYYFLQFSRVGWTDVISGVFLGLSLFWVIIKVQKSNKKKIRYYVLAGVLTGVIFYGYRSGIITILVAMFTLVPKNIKSLNNIKTPTVSFLIFLLLFFLTAYPWIRTIYQNREKYNLRLRVVSINNVNKPYYGFSEKESIFKYQVTNTLDSWIFMSPLKLSGSEDPRYLPQGFQIVNWFVKIGFWVGFIYGITKIKKIYPLYLIFLMGIYGQIITVDPPNGARGLILLPCIYLFLAIGINMLTTKFKKFRYLYLCLTILSVAYSIADFLFYQYWMSWIKV